ncbi:hypothetical protein HHI36_008155 [Cryptolaemus montrouzieri]|uniref:Rab-GAP TBC domain-containing protein n=1 Tax=Cryptolaemus montrouzieri TaxID=559131 RepID=A0ABD2MRX9_9CUCU
MLAALILQVTDKSETDALKLMIYLIEGVLPDSYFADSLRGLSVDMAVFRELLKTRLPRLSKHLDLLQNMAREGTTSYEPPLTNVFTMQWFLTLFCNCLPQPSVLRVWDLILLEGNEILLRTALAIWQALADKIQRVKTADEFYCIMGLLTNELLENNLIDANTLIKTVVTIGPLTELRNLREHYLYNINPWGTMPSSLDFSEKQLKIHPKERLALDISTLKKQYTKLRQRQRQAHIIFTAAISRQPPPRAPVAMNHLLLGKSALVPAKRIGPPKGSIPPVRIVTSTIQWKDASKLSTSSSSSDTELCDENDPPSDSSDDINHKSAHPELPEDNPPQSDNPELMNKDNTLNPEISAKLEELDINQTYKVSDIFDSVTVTIPSELEGKKLVDDDSEDDSVDFELFLEDRVKFLKEEESPTEEEKRVGLSRRNSERALQIIQENSLILHRILQCQSRLSVSPLLTEAAGDDNLYSEQSLDLCQHSVDKILSPSCSASEISSENSCTSMNNTSSINVELIQAITHLPLPNTTETLEIEADLLYRSKYREIFAKSKDLNDKYKNLILNSDITFDCDEDLGPESKTFANQDKLIDLSSNPINTLQFYPENISISTGISSTSKPSSLRMSIDKQSEEIYHLATPDITLLDSETKHDSFNIQNCCYQSQLYSPLQCDAGLKNLKEREKTDDYATTSINTDYISSSHVDTQEISSNPELLLSASNSNEMLSVLNSCDYTFSTVGREKSLSATNSIDKINISPRKRSLSATNSIETTRSPSLRDSANKVPEYEVNTCSRLNETKSDKTDETTSLFIFMKRLAHNNSTELESYPYEDNLKKEMLSLGGISSPDRKFESSIMLSPNRESFGIPEDIFSNFEDDKYNTKYSSINDEVGFSRIGSTLAISPTPKNVLSTTCVIHDKIRDTYSISETTFPIDNEEITSISRNVSPVNRENRSNTNIPPISTICDCSNKRSSKSSGSPEICSESVGSYASAKADYRTNELQNFYETRSRRRDYSQIEGSTRYRDLITPEQNITTPSKSPPNRENDFRNISPIGEFSHRSTPSPDSHEKLSPSMKDYEEMTSKSPSKIFNPFPVPLNSRQNKKVAVNLGLYKK